MYAKILSNIIVSLSCASLVIKLSTSSSSRTFACMATSLRDLNSWRSRRVERRGEEGGERRGGGGKEEEEEEGEVHAYA